MDLDALLNPGTLALLLPVLGMLGWIVAVVAKHRERMAMIDKGMNPDAGKGSEKTARVSPALYWSGCDWNSADNRARNRVPVSDYCGSAAKRKSCGSRRRFRWDGLPDRLRPAWLGYPAF
jgi:hypothetical protein